ncbi:MAG: hypothetical protein JNK64_13160 [Myxococcales bacterium]|nr:hypothetical protein [Myxococcales bacterium]
MPIPTVESTAAPLPFLVEHGAWIWKALIGLAAVGAPGLARLHRRRQATAHVARVVRGATVELRSGQIALRGRLSDADLRSSRQQVWSYAAPHVTAGTADGAALTVGDTRVELAGDIEVVAGTRATVDRWPGRTKAGALIAWRQELTVAAGAEVVCVGRLEQDDAGTWTLRAAPAQRLELYGLDHRGAAAPTARMRLAVSAALAAAGMAAMLVVLGVVMERRIHAAKRHDASLADIPLHVQVAAATPTGRAEAMRWLEDAAGHAVGREQIGRALTVARLRGRDVEAQQLRDLDRHEELLAFARRRGDDALAFEALTRLGRFAEAADVMPHVSAVDPGVAVEVAIAAGRWSDAAALVEVSARGNAPGPGRDAMMCVAAWMRTKSGDAAAAAWLDRAARHDGTCALVVAATAPGGLPQGPSRRFQGDLPARWRGVARALTGEWVTCGIADGAVWLVPYVAIHLGEVAATNEAQDGFIDELGIGTAARFRHRCRAAWALIADQPGASPESLKADAIYTAAPVWDIEPVDTMAPAAALRRRVFDRGGLMLTDRRASQVVLDALDGDARPLAHYLQHRRLAQRYLIVLGIAPRVADGQAELAEALLWSPRLTDHWIGDGGLIGETLRRAFLRRSVLRLLGRDDLAAPDAAIVARVVDVLADRDKVLALAFWSAR